MLAWENTDKGFTLLELVLAISILAVLSGMGYLGFSSILKTKEAIEAEGDNLAQLQKVYLIIGRDFDQVVSRVIRDGQVDLPALMSKDDGQNIVEFTRNGLTNPLELQRSHLQRVAYQVKDNKLFRLYWPHLDRLGNEKPYQQLLISGVDQCLVKFLDHDNKWIYHWPPDSKVVVPDDFSEGLPKAISFTLILKDWGKIERLYPLLETTKHEETAI